MINRVVIIDDKIKSRLLNEEFNFEDLTILHACNGSGKSTLLSTIASQDENLIKIEGQYNKIAHFKYHNARKIDETHADSEVIMDSILDFINHVRYDDQIDVVLIDDIDFGLSVEHVNIVFYHIRTLVQKGKQVIFSCNSYHPIFITRRFTNMITGKLENCNSYEEYYGTAIESRNIVVLKGRMPGYSSY